MKQILKDWLGITALEVRVRNAEQAHRRLQEHMVTLLRKLGARTLDEQLEELIQWFESEGDCKEEPVPQLQTVATCQKTVWDIDWRWNK